MIDEDNFYAISNTLVDSGPTILAKRLSNLDRLPDEFAYRLVKQEYKSFLSYIDRSEELNFLKSNTRFLTYLIQVCMEETLSYEDRIYCNNMIYNMFPVNQYIAKLYTFLSTVVNNNMTHKIINNCEFNQVSSSYIAVARKSSFRQDENIIRLNSAIICIGLDPSNNISVDKIIKLFSTIYTNIRDLTELFLNILKDNYVYQSDDDWITPEVIYISNCINRAILTIIESQPEPIIEEMMLRAYNMISIESLDHTDLRFSLKDIDKTIYPKIISVLNNLTKKEIYFNF